MDEFVNKMVEKVGIDKATAHKVIDFLKDHAGEALAYIQKSGLGDKLPSAVGGPTATLKKL